MAEQPPCSHASVYSKVNRVWGCAGEEMGSSIQQEGHILHNQWKLLTIKTGKRKKCKPTRWQAFRLEVIRMALSLRVCAKPTARLHPSGVMKESIISTPSRGKPSGSQHLCADTDLGLVYCCSDEQRSTLIPGSVRALSPSPSTSHCTEA